MEKNVKVCVTGGAGYLASFLVKQLLERGYVVHATLRSLGDASKVGLLKGLAHADTRLKLFEADIYKPFEFEAAIEGCEIVVHMATPMQHYTNNSQYKNTSEAAVAGAKMIMESCIKSNTVKKLIYTASVVSASPLKEDGSGYKDFIDETCWTQLNLSYGQYLSDYTYSKTLAEKEVLSYSGKGVEVVSIACGLVGGDTIQSSMSASESMGDLLSQVLNNGSRYQVLWFMEDLLGKVPIVHTRDVIEAHIFSMENSCVDGRYLCASDFLTTAEIASLIQKSQPSLSIPQDFIEVTKRDTKWGSRKLEDLGFQYKFDAEKIISDSLLCAERLGDVSKVGLLKGLSHAETRLKLFEADIYKPDEFAAAIEGCEIVVHMATPLRHYANSSQYKNTSEAAVAGAMMIMESCIKSNTVKKLIYTASVVAAAPLKEDGSGFKDLMDETCWTPLNLSYDQFLIDYVHSKTLAEKEVLSYNGKGIEVVSIACGVVGGDTIQSSMSGSMEELISQVINNGSRYKYLRFLEELLGKVPIVHIQDVIEAHIFSMENSSVNGRFLCARDFLKSAEIASLIQKSQPSISIPQELIEDTKRETRWGSRKLEDVGFCYKFDSEKIIDDSLLCAERLGDINF